ncbi:nucleotidyltransferase domain-containing protein [Natronobacterium gregoryi]|uniref:Nucleotidyltransferase n=2 Tax=Natronobacterium gregoryi TaxID=44930 RepID=L0AH52_NATGS|nr:nucleotidyltransferase domain-containing protein [Natronobacterium gregoryi]AFZ72415.1 putative nucleotidyltransferase [Natronobacterium gregoryi SP2]ELY64680.1 Nucleotidyltransferase [Natronobacterium gregoryi SP2]PLK19263.1 nucleotidyltransferase [Natronobacterium gregoryi SP2]SFJ56158.1 hypothetical protein SAMN05443661_13920 [Natronobacterium gregoryi]
MSTVPQHVFETADEALSDLEQHHDVAIPLAVAHGSYAWCGASPDSDYDVAFVFVPADLRQYAHLEKPVETITDDRDDLELQGIDVRRFAELLSDSNESAIDLLRSPVQYRTEYDPCDLRTYVERTYDPMDLYHDWRAIAATNYRTYLSEHLVCDGDVYPILDVHDGDDGREYVVRAEDGTRTVSADDERYAETQTKPTVKRNLTICRAAMAARYLRETGESGDHDLPAISFEAFLSEQAPTVLEDERIELACDLLERKRAGDGSEEIGDVVGHEFAHPEREIDPTVHARDGPDPTRLDEFVDEIIDAADRVRL